MINNVSKLYDAIIRLHFSRGRFNHLYACIDKAVAAMLYKRAYTSNKSNCKRFSKHRMNNSVVQFRNWPFSCVHTTIYYPETQPRFKYLSSSGGFLMDCRQTFTRTKTETKVTGSTRHHIRSRYPSRGRFDWRGLHNGPFPKYINRESSRELSAKALDADAALSLLSREPLISSARAPLLN